MSNFSASISDLVQPVGGTHAIERVSVGIEWAEELSHAQMVELSDLLDPDALGLGRKIEIRSTEISGDDSEELRVPSAEETNLTAIYLDYGFDEVDDDHIPAILVRRNGMLYSVKNNYEGWTRTRQKATEFSEIILSYVRQHIEIRSIGLQVIDAFLLKASGFDFAKILNKECDLLPPKIFKADKHWHIDLGFFEVENEGERLLTNAKLAYVPEVSKNKLTITCLHRLDSAAVRKEPISVADAISKYDILYSKNKELIEQVLHKDVASLIGLGTEDK
ncbi:MULTISPECIES: hypothetical protein [Pseudomonadaceae]|uniref:hypothetical protein n=1 Tax=Pseudomonas solani TaxID=2731552 RepID=UPI0005BB0B3F